MVPKLRFKEFCGEWDEKTIGDIAEIYKGNVLSKSDLRDEGHPCILYGELYTKYGEIIEKVYSKTNRADKNLFIGKINDVLIPSSGETAIDISTASCLKCDNVYIGGDLNVIRCNNVNGSFLSYTLNHKQRNSIAKFAQGVSVVHLYGNEYSGYKIKVPSLSEQTKIGDFLSTVDDKIQNQQDKITHLENIKKGFMQKIFSRKIRFKNDGGDEFPEWEEKKLGDIADIKKGTQLSKSEISDNGKYYHLNGGINPSNYTDKFNVEKNTISISEGGNSCGYINWNKERFFSGGHNYTIQNLINIIDKYYLYQYLKYNQKKIMRLRVGTGLPNIQQKDLNIFIVKFPCLKEQQKIADFLSLFDEKISTEKETLEHLKELKKGLLQQMFV